MAKKKTTRLERSQAAHKRLFNKYVVSSGREETDLAEYHWYVMGYQKEYGRILKPVEKKRLFDHLCPFGLPQRHYRKRK